MSRYHALERIRASREAGFNHPRKTCRETTPVASPSRLRLYAEIAGLVALGALAGSVLLELTIRFLFEGGLE